MRCVLETRRPGAGSRTHFVRVRCACRLQRCDLRILYCRFAGDVWGQYFDLSAGDRGVACEVQAGSGEYRIGFGKCTVGAAEKSKYTHRVKIKARGSLPALSSARLCVTSRGSCGRHALPRLRDPPEGRGQGGHCGRLSQGCQHARGPRVLHQGGRSPGREVFLSTAPIG